MTAFTVLLPKLVQVKKWLDISFRVGGASGTIAKTISAYDKNFSDTIYGEEDDRRYVTETRLHKMLEREIMLLETRIPRANHPDKMFFAYRQYHCDDRLSRKNTKDMGGWVFDTRLLRNSPLMKF